MDKTCPTCPFLSANKDKPSPTGFKCDAENNTDWYSQKNMDRIWLGCKLDPEAFLTCHTTDPTYYGKEGGKRYACVGIVLCVYMHIKIYEKADCNRKKYVAMVGKGVAMSKFSMAEKVFSILLGRTGIFGGLILPKSLSLDLDTLRWPTGFEKTVEEFKKILTQEK